MVRRFEIKDDLEATKAALQAKSREYIPSTAKSKLKKGWQVVKTDPTTNKKTPLTVPSHLSQAKRSKRGMEGIGIADLSIVHSDELKKVKKKKKKTP